MKNVVIFADGTGQAGGIAFDEDRSHIYKLYRAARVAPDSLINPTEQVAFYDPGLGSVGDGGHMIGRTGRWIYNKISRATGLGITANIVDGYAALIRLWRRDDKIFIFGFSRGAYTVRCLASVIALCGIPTQEKNGGKLKYDFNSSRRLAKEVVKNVYQYTYSKRPDAATKRENELMAQRDLLARRFRAEHNSADPTTPEKANVYPHFVGVFDTVASIAGPIPLRLILIVYLALSAAVALAIQTMPYYWPWVASFRLFTWLHSFNFLPLSALLAIAGPAIAYIVYKLRSIQWARGLPGHKFYRTVHFTQLKQKFRDLDLNEHVGYARHAISIDENRYDFMRVPWGYRDHKHGSRDEHGNYWFQQIWFAGNHSDIGGSYPENESRLSDIALQWMIDEAVKVGLKIDSSVLRLYPSHDGMQHDEVAAGFPLITRWTGLTWRKALREIPNSRTTVHGSVYKRFECGEVLHYDTMGPYLPQTLRSHDDFKKYYVSPAQPPAQPLTPAMSQDPDVPAPTKEQPDS